MAELNTSLPQNPMQPLTNHHLFIHVKKNIILVILFFVIGLGVGFGVGTMQSKNTPMTISVVGKASQQVEADKATITGTTYETGPDEVNATINEARVFGEIKSKLLSLGVKETDIRVVSQDKGQDYTDSSGSYNYPTPTIICLGGSCPVQPAPIVVQNQKFYASTIFEIHLDKSTIDKETTIDSLLNAHSTNPSTVYNLSNKDSLNVSNKQKAIQDARMQAEAIAKTNKLAIKKLVTLKEANPTNDQNYGTYPDDPTVDAQQRTISITTTFEVTYELAPALFSF